MKHQVLFTGTFTVLHLKKDEDKSAGPSMQTTDFSRGRSAAFYPFPARFVGGDPSVDK